MNGRMADVKKKEYFALSETSKWYEVFVEYLTNNLLVSLHKYIITYIFHRINQLNDILSFLRFNLKEDSFGMHSIMIFK